MMVLSLVGAIALLAAQGADATYELYAVRFGTIPAFQVSGLVAGADSSRRLDIPVMVWLLKGSNGRNVLVDSGFFRENLVERWKVRDFRRPSDAVQSAGVSADAVTDIIISHAHWDHAGGLELFPKATIWIQREEYTYYTGEAWHARNTHGGIDADDMLALVRANTASGWAGTTASCAATCATGSAYPTAVMIAARVSTQIAV